MEDFNNYKIEQAPAELRYSRLQDDKDNKDGVVQDLRQLIDEWTGKYKLDWPQNGKAWHEAGGKTKEEVMSGRDLVTLEDAAKKAISSAAAARSGEDITIVKLNTINDQRVATSEKL